MRPGKLSAAMRRHLLALIAALMLAGIVAAPLVASSASAAAPNPNADCNANSRLTAHYTPTQLRHALATMPADLKEYTDCYDVIQRTLLGELGQLHGSGSGSSGGSFLPTPVLVVLIVLVLGGAGVATVALRRRGGDGEAD
jgi:hypothetical protein